MAEKLIDDPLIGQQFANFRLDRVIGRGGMAVVYYGMDVKLNRPVAIKVIDARYRGNPAYAERFIRESQVVATWRHPNVLQVYYADDESDLYYFVMEYVDGLDLRKLMDMYNDEGQLLPIDDVVRIGYSVADALDYAHTRGVIHRDIKPSNVMVATDGRVLLMDFGLALQVTEGSMGEVFGTPHYMAPEQAKRSADAVPQSDIYSLGVLLYEMLTGSVPFDDSSPTSVAIQHITQPPPAPRLINPKLNISTEEVLLKALEKGPSDRYQTAREMLNALARALSEGAEAFERDALPPMPAGVQRPMPTGGSRPGTVLTVAERMALYVETRSGVPTEVDPMAGSTPAPTTTPPTRSPIWSWLGGAVIMLAILAIWGGMGGFGWLAPAPTPTPTLPPVVAVVPTNTPTATHTPTLTPSPTATETAVPTTTPTETPTLTPSPTATETAVPTLTPSPTPPTSLLLIYTRTGLYVINRTAETIDLTPLTLNAIDGDGNPTNYAFQASTDWRFKNLAPGYCSGIEILNTQNTRPSQCEGFASLTFPGQDGSQYFWREREGITQFRVAWFGETVKICQIIDGFCSVRLP